jgi:hypothetical protein
MHLLNGIVKGGNPEETKATLIHEAAHLADSKVDDHVYYSVTGFFEADETTKVGNAAHYEELPRRVMKTSAFDGKTFTPGVKSGGGAVSQEDKVRAAAANFLRKAWDAAVDAHTFIRGVRQQYLSSNNKPFKDNETLIMEMSKLMDMTIHEQKAGHQIVTTLDVTISESIARSTIFVQRELSKVAFPSPVPPGVTDDQLKEQLVAGAGYGQLMKDATRDKALLDWLVAHYRAMPSA